MTGKKNRILDQKMRPLILINQVYEEKILEIQNPHQIF